MKKLFIILVIFFFIQGCSVYDYFFTPTPNKTLRNNSFSWISDTTEKVIYHFEKEAYTQNDIQIIKNITERSIDRILGLINEKRYPEVIVFFIVSSKERMQELTNYTFNAFSYPRLNVVYAIIGNDIRAVGGHEFNHIVVENMWGRSEDWLEEGFAVYSDDKWHDFDLHTLNKYLLDKNKLLNVATLIGNFNSRSSLITYPQSGSMVKYLYEKYGEDKFKLLWQNGSGSFEKIYNKSISEFEKEWTNEIQRYDTKGIIYKL